MNRYPAWVYLTVVLALALGVLYALPNLFGETPAVQISSARPTLSADQGVLRRAEEALKTAQIPSTGVLMDANGIRMRFASVDVQARARDVIDHAVNADPAAPDFTVALNLMSDSPGWLGALHALPMYLGLDLRGGVHFLYQVDLDAAVRKRLEGMVGNIRSQLRDNGIRHHGIGREGNSVVIRFIDAPTRDRARKVVQEAFPEISCEDQDAGGEFRVLARVRPEAVRQIQEDAVHQNISTFHNRVNELGVSEPIIQQQGRDRILVQLPGVQDTARAKDILGRTATLEFRLVDAHAGAPDARDSDPSKVTAALKGDVPLGSELYFVRNDRAGPGADGRGEPILVSKQVILTGDRLTGASAGFDQNQRPSVNIDLDSQGGRTMRDVTREAVKRRMAVLLIEKGVPTVLTAPVIQSELGNRFQITGMTSPREATDLALLLRAGSLAAPMEIIEERTVGPSLGRDNIAKGFRSTQWGFIAIAVFMIIYYMVFGLFSVAALTSNLLLLIAVLSLMQATLTLPGIAAIALTLGMAIDSNVLINERIREELRAGVSPQAAIATGYERAFGTILDSNVTTLIAGVALLTIASGPVRGFAVVHCLGIITSMFSSVVISRALVNLSFGSRRRLEQVPIGNTAWK
jgi:preprotein translocase subunit SecD